MFRFRSPICAGLASLAILLMAGSTARASFSIDFNVASSAVAPVGYPGSQVYYNGGSTDLVGNLASNFVFSSTNAVNLTGTAGGFAALTFNTGTYLNANGGVWNFGSAGSSISIVGNAPGDSGNVTLMTGSFTSLTTVQNQAGGTQQVVGTAVLSIIDPILAADLGLPVGVTWSGSLTITLNSGTQAGNPITPGSAFDDGASGGNATSTPIAGSGSSGGNVTMTPVPAPAGLVLALTALPCLGVGRWLRRRNKSN
jgi:hypothetical protein